MGFFAIFILTIIIAHSIRFTQSAVEREAAEQAKETQLLTRDEIAAGFSSVFTELNDASFRLARGTPSYAPSQLKAQITFATENVTAIMSRQISFSQMFLVSLDFDRRAFAMLSQRSKTKTPVTQENLGRVNRAESDIRMKATFVSTNQTDSIPTQVSTTDYRTSTPVSNCTVRYKPLNSWDERTYRDFRLPSTPTTEPVPAGWWDFWAEKNGIPGQHKQFIFYTNETLRLIDIGAP